MLIDGQKIANEIQQAITSEIKKLPGRPPCLAVIQVGNIPASTIYVRRKIEACKSVGMESIFLPLLETVTSDELLQEIEKLNQSDTVDGILVQFPLPAHINPKDIKEKISPEKDVDGFHPINMGRLLMGEHSGFIPCTPLGIRTLLTKSGIEITGKHVAIIGRSMIVGKPLAALFLQDTPEGNATVTILHSRSANLADICRTADIVIVAIGKPKFLTKQMVKKGAVVIDVGINQIPDPSKKSGYRIIGDADFDQLKDHCSAITPVPGGVGPMTIAMLLSNNLYSYKRRHS